MRNQEGRLNCSCTISCPSPGTAGAALPAQGLLQPWNPTGTPRGHLAALHSPKGVCEQKGMCHFTQVSAKALKAWTECFLCNELFPLHSRYLSIGSLSGKRPTPRNPTENQMLTHQQKQLHFSLVYMSLSLGQLYVFPAADKKNITEIWQLLLHESIKISCTWITLQSTWMEARGEKLALPTHGQSAAKGAESQENGSNGDPSLWLACLWSNSQSPGFGNMIVNVFRYLPSLSST